MNVVVFGLAMLLGSGTVDPRLASRTTTLSSSARSVTYIPVAGPPPLFCSLRSQ